MPEPKCNHTPDWKSISLEWDGDDLYVDVACKDCGQSGCVGTAKTLEEDISWE